MVAMMIAILAALVTAIAETIHSRRIHRVGKLAFGPTGLPCSVGRVLPWFKPVAVGLLTWGLITLVNTNPKVYQQATVTEEEIRHDRFGAGINRDHTEPDSLHDNTSKE